MPITAAQGVLAGLSPVAAILLEEISQRYPDAKATFGGHFWLAATRKQLQHWTGLTEWKLRKSLQELKCRKLIKVEQHKNELGVAVSFIRPLVTELPSSSQSGKGHAKDPFPQETSLGSVQVPQLKLIDPGLQGHVQDQTPPLAQAGELHFTQGGESHLKQDEGSNLTQGGGDPAQPVVSTPLAVGTQGMPQKKITKPSKRVDRHLPKKSDGGSTEVDEASVWSLQRVTRASGPVWQ